MDIILAHRIELVLKPEQEVLCAKSCGVARKAYNLCMDERERRFFTNRGVPKEMRLPTDEASLRRWLNAIKHEQFPWMAEVSKNVPQQAAKNLGEAWKRFFGGVSEKPRHKKKGKSRDSFRADGGTDQKHPHAVQVNGKRVRLPVIGWVRMREELRFGCQIVSVVVSRRANRWFASFSIRIRGYEPPARDNQAVVGVDLGLRTMAVVSDGTEYVSPMPLRRSLRKLRRLNKAVHRKKKGSANQQKARMRVAKLYARIANVRQDCLHKATSSLVHRYGVICIEDLNVKAMMKLRSQSRAMSDVGMGEFRRQIEYKAKLYGTIIIKAGRYYPSSKTCNDCGVINAALKREKFWTCDACGVTHDRDINASRNLRDYALWNMAGSSTVTACGGTGSGRGRKSAAKPAPLKNEAGSRKSLHQIDLQ